MDKLGGRVLEWALREKFIATVEPDVVAWILTQEPKTIDGAAKQADLYRSGHPKLEPQQKPWQGGTSQRPRPWSGRPPSQQGAPPRPHPPTSSNHTPQQVDKQQEWQRLSRPTEEKYANYNNSGYGMKSRTPSVHQGQPCYGCGEFGHIKYYCPNKKNCYTVQPSKSLNTLETRPVFPGTIGRCDADRILIDSGSTVSIVHKRWVPEHYRHTGMMNMQGLHTSQPLEVMKVHIRLQGRSFFPNVVVSDQIDFDAILGMDVEGLLGLVKQEEWTPNAWPSGADTIRERLDFETGPFPEEASAVSPSKHQVSYAADQDMQNEEVERTDPEQVERPESSRPKRRQAERYYSPTSFSDSEEDTDDTDDEDEEEEVSPTSPAEKDRTPEEVTDPKINPRKRNPNRWGPKIPLEGGSDQLKEAQEQDGSLFDCRRKSKLKDSKFGYTDGLLIRKWTSPHGEEELEQLVLPRQYRESTLRMAHFFPFVGHFGRKRTTERILHNFFWPGLRRDAAEVCRQCATCQKTAVQRTPRYPLVPLPVMEEPFQRIAMDMVGPLIPSSEAEQFYNMLT